MDKSTHQIRCEQWTSVFNEWAVSGMSKAAWCKANGISEKSFFYWQRILRTESYIENALSVPKQDDQKGLPVAFVELKPTATDNRTAPVFQPDIIIKRNDLVLEISNSASAELLQLIGGLLHAE